MGIHVGAAVYFQTPARERPKENRNRNPEPDPVNLRAVSARMCCQSAPGTKNNHKKEKREIDLPNIMITKMEINLVEKKILQLRACFIKRTHVRESKTRCGG